MLWIGCYSTEQLSRDQMIPGTDCDVEDIGTTSGEHNTFQEVFGLSAMVRDSVVVESTLDNVGPCPFVWSPGRD